LIALEFNALDVRTFEANAFGAKALNDVPFVVSDQSAAGAGAAAATAAQSRFEYCQYKKGRRSSHRPLAMTPCRGPDVYTKSPSSLRGCAELRVGEISAVRSSRQLPRSVRMLLGAKILRFLRSGFQSLPAGYSDRPSAFTVDPRLRADFLSLHCDKANLEVATRQIRQ
jgi:hypothetical protein